MIKYFRVGVGETDRIEVGLECRKILEEDVISIALDGDYWVVWCRTRDVS